MMHCYWNKEQEDENKSVEKLGELNGNSNTRFTCILSQTRLSNSNKRERKALGVLFIIAFYAKS